MRKQRVPASLRRRVRKQAQFRCGYCLRTEELAGERLTLEHIRPESRVRLFNPRTQEWAEHFAWDETGAEIQGVTPVGRATITALRLNNAEIVVARRLWVAAGWWPPED